MAGKADEMPPHRGRPTETTMTDMTFNQTQVAPRTGEWPNRLAEVLTGAELLPILASALLIVAAIIEIL
ncbi:hypothetical protein HHL28_02500 [Aerophototrophica crusticola]|uniref:Uncharacterized protein n=1 Tax=Aerophototrophica crusticola TaxID=1709002 RepID=A0A858R405_9PROT|nr:hypothetical protein HHL28_02500 [Rhodospirillaceae bacterium B3]